MSEQNQQFTQAKAAELIAALKPLDGETESQFAVRRTFASIVLDAMAIREESYDHAASDSAQAEYLAKCEANPHNLYLSPDYAKFYGMSETEAAEAAAKKHGLPMLAHLVYLAVSSWPSDVYEWATGKHFEPVGELRSCTSCNWSGKTDRMCGSAGPLCPECGDTTEIVHL